MQTWCRRCSWLLGHRIGIVLTTRKHVGLVVDYANFELCNRICLRKRNISPDCFRLLIRGPQMTFLSYLFTFIQTLEVWESSYFLGISVRPFTRLLFCTLMNAAGSQRHLSTLSMQTMSSWLFKLCFRWADLLIIVVLSPLLLLTTLLYYTVHLIFCGGKNSLFPLTILVLLKQVRVFDWFSMYLLKGQCLKNFSATTICLKHTFWAL